MNFGKLGKTKTHKPRERKIKIKIKKNTETYFERNEQLNKKLINSSTKNK